MARAALECSQDLAQAAAVGVNTVNRFETDLDACLGSLETNHALEIAGIEFVSNDRGESVVKQRKGQKGQRAKRAAENRTCITGAARQ